MLSAIRQTFRSLCAATVALGAAASAVDSPRPAVMPAPAPASAANAWEAVGWGGGGYFWSCAYHPTDSNVIYLGGDVCGMLKSVDKGRHWTFINQGIVDYGVFSMAISKSNPDVLYIGTMGGVCKTTDGGANWTFLEQTGKEQLKMLTDRPRSVRALAIDPVNPDVVYMGTNDGKIYKTVDGGTNWTKTYETIPPAETLKADATAKKGRDSKVPFSSLAIALTNPKVVFASSLADGILRSTDAGASWTRLATPTGAMSVVVAPYDANTIYAAFDKKGLMKSTDQGKRWTAVAVDKLGDHDIREIVLHPQDPQIIQCIAGKGWGSIFLRTTDGGKSWQMTARMKQDLTGNPTLPQEGSGGTVPFSAITNLAVNPGNPEEMFISGNWRNAFSADGGQTWENRDTGADISCVTDLEFSGDRVYATAMDEGLFMTDNGGKQWQQLFPLKWGKEHSGHQWQVRVTRQGGVDHIVSTLNPWDAKTPAGRILVSENGGATFQMTTKGFPEKKSAKDCMWGESILRALAVDPKNPQVLYAGLDGDPEPAKGVDGGGIFKSVDGGLSWARLPNQPDSRRMFYGLAVCPTDSKRLYWAASGDRGGLYRSEDGGQSWEKAFEQEKWLFNLAVSPAGTVYTGKANLWKSADHGRSWKKLTAFTEKQDIVAITVDPENENRIWVGRRIWSNEAVGSVWRSVDGGATWEDITGNLPVRHPMVLRYNPRTRELWTGAFSGIFKIKQ